MEQVGEGLDHSRNEEVWKGGGALWYAHRVDLHEGLLGLVVEMDDDEIGNNGNGEGKEEVNGVDGMDGKRRKGRKGWVRIEGGKEVVAYVSAFCFQADDCSCPRKRRGLLK